MLDRFGKEFKIGDFIAYPDFHYKQINVALITKLTNKTFRYKYLSKNFGFERIVNSIANNPNQAIIINDLINESQKEELKLEIK